MKFTPEVIAALNVLRNAAENDFERHRLDVLERDLTSPPKVEVIDTNHQSFNGLKFGRGSSTKHLTRSFFLHRVIFQYYYGEIPTGYDVHHRDFNPANNDISNLQLLTKSQHANIHLGAGSPKEYICEYCGKKFIATSQSPARFCSRNCLSSYHRQTKKIPHYQKVCPICKKEFVTTQKTQNYCSLKCFGKTLAKPSMEKICAFCGKSFSTKKESAKYCSVKCVNESRKTKKPKTCPICGKSFVYRNKTEVYCSRSCASKARFKPKSTLETPKTN